MGITDISYEEALCAVVCVAERTVIASSQPQPPRFGGACASWTVQRTRCACRNACGLVVGTEKVAAFGKAKAEELFFRVFRHGCRSRTGRMPQRIGLRRAVCVQ